jgi:hypothetical protein
MIDLYRGFDITHTEQGWFASKDDIDIGCYKTDDELMDAIDEYYRELRRPKDPT